MPGQKNWMARAALVDVINQLLDLVVRQNTFDIGNTNAIVRIQYGDHIARTHTQPVLQVDAICIQQ